MRNRVATGEEINRHLQICGIRDLRCPHRAHIQGTHSRQAIEMRLIMPGAKLQTIINLCPHLQPKTPKSSPGTEWRSPFRRI